MWPNEWKATHRVPNSNGRSKTTWVMEIEGRYYTRSQWARMTRIRKAGAR